MTTPQIDDLPTGMFLAGSKLGSNNSSKSSNTVDVPNPGQAVSLHLPGCLDRRSPVKS